MNNYNRRKVGEMSSSTVRQSSYVFEYRLTFLGAEKVGKSTIIKQFIEKIFLEKYTATAEDHLTHVVEHRGNLCVCLLVDTAGNDDFPAMRKLSISKGNAFIVVYSVDDRKSFQRAKTFVQDIKNLKHYSSEIKIVLVGNKCDLESKRKVTYNEGLSYSASLHEGNVITSFVETSAKEYDNVTEIFHKILTMFIPPPPQIEVPVLERKKSLPNKFRSSFIRKTSKTLIERKLSGNVTTKTNRKGSLSDSELGRLSKPSPLLSPKLLMRKLRRRADSQPIIQTPFVDMWGPPPPLITGPRFLRSRIGSLTQVTHVEPISEISTPTLISHSATLNRYKMNKSRSISINSNSSDSGVDDDCHLSEYSPKLDLKDFNNRISIKPRRSSINEKMRGIFRRTKSVSHF